MVPLSPVESTVSHLVPTGLMYIHQSPYLSLPESSVFCKHSLSLPFLWIHLLMHSFQSISEQRPPVQGACVCVMGMVLPTQQQDCLLSSLQSCLRLENIDWKFYCSTKYCDFDFCSLSFSPGCAHKMICLFFWCVLWGHVEGYCESHASCLLPNLWYSTHRLSIQRNTLGEWKRQPQSGDNNHLSGIILFFGTEVLALLIFRSVLPPLV